MCSVTEFPYRTNEQGGWLLSPIHEKIDCRATHEAPWVVPINQRWGIDLVGAGAECLILFCCVGIAGLARKYANTRTSDYWPTIVFFISVVVAIFFILAIVNVTFVRIGWWR